MKAKLLSKAGDITEGTAVEIASPAGKNDKRSDKDVGGRSTTAAPVYKVIDDDEQPRRSTRETSNRCPSACRSGSVLGVSSRVLPVR